MLVHVVREPCKAAGAATVEFFEVQTSCFAFLCNEHWAKSHKQKS